MDPHRQADRLIPRRDLPAAALLAAGALGLAACARMEPPPGGPEDRTRPFVAAAYPGPGAVNVPRELKARIAFSEWVARDAERGKVWLSPPPAGRLVVEARGDILEISAEGPLDSGTTYVLGVAGTVKDLVGQPLEAPFRLSFSTGPSLDTSALEGRLSAFPGSRAPAGAFAALYPEDRALRARFAHLGPRPPSRDGDAAAGIVPADSLPDPFREKPAYLASADSLGRFRLEGMRPGRYLLLGFLDADQDALPDAVTEQLAPGPSVSVGAGTAAPASLALSPLDTAANRLIEARWAHESLKLGLSRGTLRLRFSRPLHPAKALRRELYAVRSDSGAGTAGAVPVLDLCLNPDGELELYTAPLAPGARYTVSCGPVPDALGNPLDTARDEAGFVASVGDSAARAATARSPSPDSARTPAGGAGPAAIAPAAGDSAWPAPVFLGARRVGGTRGRQAQEPLFPSRGLHAYFPRILGDSLMAVLRDRLEVKADTAAVPFALERVNHHEFRIRFTGRIPLLGQALTVGFRAPRTDSVKPPAAPAVPGAPGVPGAPAAPAAPAVTGAAGAPPLPRVTLTVADSARLGSLRFLQDASARGAVLVLRNLGSGFEAARITPASEAFAVDSLPEGWYSAAYFRDADRDTLWNPGRLRPWTSQEEFVLLADSIQVKPGGTGAGGPSGGRLAFPPSW